MFESDDHRDLRQSVRRLLERHAPEPSVHASSPTEDAFDAGLWHRLAQELGVASLGVPEHLDGAGFGVRELAIIAEELGRRLVRSPFLASVAMATQVLLEAHDEEALVTLLPGLMDGTSIATVLLPQHGAGWGTETTAVAATLSPDGASLLAGTVTHVLDGEDANVLIVPAHTADGSVGLYVVDQAAGVRRLATPGLDHTRSFARIDLHDCPARPLGTVDARLVLDRAMASAAACLAAEQLGVAQRMLDLTVEYAKTRHQFGRAIGSFQAVKHKLADSLIALELARATVTEALQQLESDGPAASQAVSIAKAVSSEAGYQVCANAIQVFGGIGVTWEHPAHLYFKRATSNRVLLGRPAHHREQVAAELGI